MRCLTATLGCALLLACASNARRAPSEEQAVLSATPTQTGSAESTATPAAASAAERPEVHAGAQPKPGERVRQALLDDHCGENATPIAFYYHGGRPFAQRALGDGCRPLYLIECAENGTCAESREQEAGMWCCGEPSQSGAQSTAHAEHRR
jgi:hypothetical protein